jgi:branched-chain amino acid transport system permease protein
MISGALFAGLGATQGLIPQAFQTWFGLNGTWPLLIGAIGLLVTLVANPDGIAGTAYGKKRAARIRAAGGPGGRPWAAGAGAAGAGATTDTQKVGSA